MTTLYERVKADLDKKLAKRNEVSTSLSKLPLPSTIPYMASAAKRVIKAYENNEKILIVGDYDLDGIAATSLMILAFEDAGLVKGEHFDWIVPDRFIDGYGVSKNMVDYAIKGGFKLIITVDNGISAVEAVDYANENGIEVVITDHHTPGDVVPNASVIVDLKYKKGKFPMVDISGCTIAWFFQAQFKLEAKKRSKKRKEAYPIKEINLADYVDLVGLTVISDVMPLVGMNIGFYQAALKAVKSGKRLAYQLFFNVDKRKTLTETDLSFGMIPAMNAVGRLSNAKYAVMILTAKNTTVVQEQFAILEDINRQRKKLSNEQLEEIMPEAKKQFEEGKKAIIIYQDNLHEGIVGILAGKLAEEFDLPAYVFGYNEKKDLIKGSGRSVGEVQLYDLTKTAEDKAAGFGGHAGAVGVGIKKDNFEAWREIIWENASKLPAEDFINKDIQMYEVLWNEIDFEFVKMVNSYRPFGEGFEEPLFKMKNAKININKELGTTGQHWEATVEDENHEVRNVAFFFTPSLPSLDNQKKDIKLEFAFSAFGNNLYIKNHGKLLS